MKKIVETSKISETFCVLLGKQLAQILIDICHVCFIDSTSLLGIKAQLSEPHPATVI